MAESAHPVILFDGVCHLCNGFVLFVLRHDSNGRFHIAPLQGEFARAQLGQRPLDSVVLIVGSSVFEAEEAVIRILLSLDAPWPKLGAALQKLPRAWLAWGYRMVARYRYRVFGRAEVCVLPKPEWKGRFLA